MNSFDASNDYKSLVELGLSKAEALIYLSALDLGQGTISDLAHNAGIERTRVYYHIENLKQMGLLEETVLGKRTIYLPSDPKALKSILETKKHKLDQIYPAIDRQYSIATSKSISEYYNGVERSSAFYDRLYQLLTELESSGEEVLILGTSFKGVTSRHPVFQQYKQRDKLLDVKVRCILPMSQKSKEADCNRYDPYIIKRFNMKPAQLKFIADKYAYPGAVVIINDLICLLDYRNFNYSIIENANNAQTWRIFFNYIWDSLSKTK